MDVSCGTPCAGFAIGCGSRDDYLTSKADRLTTGQPRPFLGLFVSARTSLEEGAREIAKVMASYKHHHEVHHSECRYGIGGESAPAKATPSLHELELVRQDFEAWKALATEEIQTAATLIRDLIAEVTRLRALLQP